MSQKDEFSATDRCYALIPCGGTGSRAGQGLPKQYRQIAGQPMVEHTLTAFAQVPLIVQTAIVIAPEDVLFSRFVTKLNTSFLVATCAGNTRSKTVLNGLNVLQSHGARALDWVLVHDAARCLIMPQQIHAVIQACRGDEIGGLMALKLPDTLKRESGGRVLSTVDRSDKWLAQTPQMFRIGPLIDALQRAGDNVTDEASAMEAIGLAPKLVAGSAQNFKVTYPEDFALAEAVIHSRRNAS